MPEQNRVDKQQYAAMQFVSIAASIAAGAALLANLVFFIQVGAWQMLFMVIAELVAIGAVWYVLKLVRQDKLNIATSLALASVFLGFGAGELVHKGLTVILALGGTLVMIMVGLIFQRRRSLNWLAFPAIYLIYFWVVNRLELFPRYEILSLSFFRVIVVIIVVLAVILAIWQFGRVIRFGSIRTRLLTSIISLALIPALLVGTLASIFGAQRSIDQTRYQLGSVADLKVNQVKVWIDNLVTNLYFAIPTSDQLGFTEMLLKEPEETELESYRVIYEREKNRYQQVMTRGQVFIEIFLLNMTGEIIVSTDSAHEDYNEFGYEYFELGLEGGGVATPFRYPYSDELAIIAVAPINNTAGEQIAVLAGRANLVSLSEILLDRAGLGEQGESYLVVSKTLQLLTRNVTSNGEIGDHVYSQGIASAVEREANGEARYENPWGVQVVGAYRALPDVGMALLSEQPESEALVPVYQSNALLTAISAVTLVVALAVALFVTSRISKPIANLASTVEQISAGNLDLVADVEQRDEIGALADAFNRMTSQLRKTLVGLEEQVKDRTAALEQRTSYLQTSAEVGRAIASVLDPDQLIRDVVDLIRERFDLYYVGLFMVDHDSQTAVLKAGTGSAGRAMLSRRHSIPIGSGMIGWCIANRASRIAQLAELDASRLANPDLPETRSEAAIPLVSRGDVIGALTIQSMRENFFDPATTAVFETMADQVAVALDNARLFVQSQQTLESLREVYGEITIDAWRKMLDENPDLGFRSEVGNPLRQEPVWSPELITTFNSGRLEHGKTGNGNHPDRVKTSQDEGESSYYIGIPLRVRERMIGVLGCYKPIVRGDWTDDEVSFMEDVGQTISVALESARFFNDTQIRAENERLVADVTSQLRQTLDIDTVLTTAVREIQRILNLAEVEIRVSGEAET